MHLVAHPKVKWRWYDEQHQEQFVRLFRLFVFVYIQNVIRLIEGKRN